MERRRINFNRDWKFIYGNPEDGKEEQCDEKAWVPIAIPHSFSLPYDLNQDMFYIGHGWYRKHFEIGAEWKDKCIFLEFEGIFQAADLYLNGKHIPSCFVYGYENREAQDVTHLGGYSGFSVDITEFIQFNRPNILSVHVDNIWRPDLTPRGGDHQFSGGIYRDVTLVITDRLHIDWYGNFVWTPALCNPAFQVSENRPDQEYKNDFERYGTGICNTLDDPSVEGAYVSQNELLENLCACQSDVEVCTEITNNYETQKKIYVEHFVHDSLGKEIMCFQSDIIDMEAGEKKLIKVRSRMCDIVLWDFENPVVYQVLTYVKSADGKLMDTWKTEFGFRSVQFTPEGFFLNGKRTVLYGANVHQDHGGWADAVTRQGLFRDVQYVKEGGFNFIRGSHYPHHPAFASACDYLGIGFWSEGGLWGIGGYDDGDAANCHPSDWIRGAYPLNPTYWEKFEQSCFDLLESMIRINRNHPSVLVWSMGNEAFFVNDRVDSRVKLLLSRMRDYAHGLDYTRKTGLGGTQRKDLNVLAVCDVAGGNGDGGTEAYTNFYLPHIVAEYGSLTSDRPGGSKLFYELVQGDCESEFVLPGKKLHLADGSELEGKSGGLAVWCMFHHGSVGNVNLRKMGIVDYYRLPLRRFFSFREVRTGIKPPIQPVDNEVKQIFLAASTEAMTESLYYCREVEIGNDGTDDVQITVNLIDTMGQLVSAEKDVIIEVVEGNGVFPSGKSYRFEKGRTLQAGQGSIEFRSYYSGDTQIRAYIPDTDIVSETLTVHIRNRLKGKEGKEPVDFFKPLEKISMPFFTEPEKCGSVDFALWRQSRADSFVSDNHKPVNAIDGKRDSSWIAGIPGAVQSWQVFLENSYFLQEIKVRAAKESGIYQVYIGEAGREENQWILVANKCCGESRISIPEMFSERIMIKFVNTPTDKYAQLFQVSAYGTVFSRQKQ